MKKILAIILLLSLTGCTKDETPITNVCQGNDGKVTITSVGNEIQTMIQQDIYTFDELNVTASFLNKEANQQELLNNYKALYSSITKGLDITMDIENTQVIFNIAIDFTQANYQELASVGIIKDANVNYVGLDQTIQQMGLTCQE